MFFFFKQKTAYEMRISDWSSDVCSSDLGLPAAVRDLHRAGDPRSAAARLPTPTGFPAPPHRPQAPSGARRNPGAGLLSAGVPLPGAAAGAARLVAGAAPPRLRASLACLPARPPARLTPNRLRRFGQACGLAARSEENTS